LFLRDPLLFTDELAFHLTDERDGSTEPEEAKPQVVPDQIADRYAAGALAASIAKILPTGDCVGADCNPSGSRRVTIDGITRMGEAGGVRDADATPC
jgi:hypothetical protein